MTLMQLSSEYRKSGELCRRRQEELTLRLESGKLCRMDRLRLSRRIYMLGTMARESIATSRYLENYYGDDENAGKETEYVCQAGGIHGPAAVHKACGPGRAGDGVGGPAGA